MDPGRIEELERTLKALASGNRLSLLVALQEPRRVTEIDLPPTRPGPFGGEERAISRQAVRNQIKALEEIGVVNVLDQGPGEVRYVVNHARLFEVTEELRELATIKARVPVAQETVALDATGGTGRAEGPHLVLVRGVREGQVFPIGGPQPDHGWLIGRAKDAHIALDYDPYVSSAHARVLAKQDRHFLVDLESARNRTFLNWQPMVRGGVAPLEPGDLVGVGMSLLLYRR